MLNETIKLTFENASAITQAPPMLIAIIMVWFIPLFFYFLIGFSVKGRSSNGQVMSKPMICYPNFWFGVMIFGLVQAGLFLMLIFPVWLRILN